MKMLLIGSAVAGVIASFAAPVFAQAPVPFCVNATPHINAAGLANNAALEASAAACVGAGPNAGVSGFAANNIQGGYVERLVASFNDPFNPGAGLQFNATTVVDLDTFKFNGFDINNLIGANGTGLDSSYDLYAVVTSSGQISGTSFNPTFASVSFYLDRNRDTLTADDPFTAGNNEVWGNVPNSLTFQGTGNGEDLLLGSSSTLIGATGTLGSGGSGGNDGFSALFDNLVLTTDGQNFFIAPSPFLIRLFADGDIDGGFVVTSPLTLDLQGNVNVSFAIPEPGSLALAGLALLGLAAVRRRKA